MLQGRAALAAILALSFALAACGGSAPTPTPTLPLTPTPTDAPQAEPAPAESVSEEVAPTDPAGLAQHLSEKTMRLWEVYNTYDIEGLKAFYSEDYWEEREEQTRLEIKPFENADLTFTAEETSPPTEIVPGKWEIKHRASFPGGSVNMVFIYERFGEEWLLTHAEPG